MSRIRRTRSRAERRRACRESGVTLIEMMVVLVIIAIVAALIVPNVIGRPDEARVTVARTDVRTIAASLEMYRLDNRIYPATAQGLEALVSRPTSPPEPPNWAAGGYLRAGAGRSVGQPLRLPLARRERALRSAVARGGRPARRRGGRRRHPARRAAVTRRRATEAGLTLVEVLVVLAIVGITTGATVLGLGVARPRRPQPRPRRMRLADRLRLAADEALVTSRAARAGLGCAAATVRRLGPAAGGWQRQPAARARDRATPSPAALRLERAGSAARRADPDRPRPAAAAGRASRHRRRRRLARSAFDGFEAPRSADAHDDGRARAEAASRLIESLVALADPRGLGDLAARGGGGPCRAHRRPGSARAGAVRRREPRWPSSSSASSRTPDRSTGRPGVPGRGAARADRRSRARRGSISRSRTSRPRPPIAASSASSARQAAQ